MIGVILILDFLNEMASFWRRLRDPYMPIEIKLALFRKYDQI